MEVNNKGRSLSSPPPDCVTSALGDVFLVVTIGLRFCSLKSELLISFKVVVLEGEAALLRRLVATPVSLSLAVSSC